MFEIKKICEMWDIGEIRIMSEYYIVLRKYYNFVNSYNVIVFLFVRDF